MDGGMDGWMDGRTDGQMDRRMDGWTEGWTDWTDGCIEGQMDECTDGQIDRPSYRDAWTHLKMMSLSLTINRRDIKSGTAFFDNESAYLLYILCSSDL